MVLDADTAVKRPVLQSLTGREWGQIMIARFAALARPYAEFALRYLQFQLSSKPKSVLNRDLLFSAFNRNGVLRTQFSYSHGADGLNYVGSGILYFAIPYMLKAQTCVCIGSGGGYVPRFMHYGQLEANVQAARTILVDADKGDLGRPDYFHQDSFFRKRFPAIQLVKMESADYAAVAKKQNITIDYLHIDGDHTYEGALSDFTNYLPLMSHKGLITFHDTGSLLPCAEVVSTIRVMGHNVINLPEIGAGIAIISPMSPTNEALGIH